MRLCKYLDLPDPAQEGENHEAGGSGDRSLVVRAKVLVQDHVEVFNDEVYVSASESRLREEQCHVYAGLSPAPKEPLADVRVRW